MAVLNVASDNATYTDTGYQYTDSNVTVYYNFWNEGGMMYMTIYNNRNIPIFIDWKTSSFVEEGNTYTYWDDRIRSNTSGSATSLYGRTFIGNIPGSVTVGSSNTTTQQEQRIVSIVPHASISRVSYRLADVNSNILDLRFRNYLVFSTKEDFSNTFMVDNSFSVESYVLVNTAVFANNPDQYKKATRFYLSNVHKAHTGKRRKLDDSPADGSGF